MMLEILRNGIVRSGVALLIWIVGSFLPPGVIAMSFENAYETRLSNTMKVILLENNTAPIVTFQVWYRTGARCDPWGKSGLAHLFEHMMFKGTAAVSGKEFVRRLQERGGRYNAFTSHDFTGYFEILSTENVGVAIELEADRMRNLLLKEEDFGTERNVVMEERRLRTATDPEALLHERVSAAAFVAQPYHWPIVGWMDDLRRIELKDLNRYYRTYYVPADAFCVVVGNFEKEALIAQLEKHFGVIPVGEKPPHYDYVDPPQRGERTVTLHKEAQLPFLILGYHVPNLEKEDSYVLEVIAAILSTGKSSRLYRNLVREGLALSARADYSLLSRDPSLFQLSARPQPETDIAAVRKALEKELARLSTEPIGDRELEQAKNQLEAYFVYGQDSLFVQAMMLARYETVSTWEDIGKYIPAIRKVSAENIQRVAGEYFVEENRTVGTLVPEKPDAAEQ